MTENDIARWFMFTQCSTFAGPEGHHGRLSQTCTVLSSHLHLIQAVWLQLGQSQLVQRA